MKQAEAIFIYVTVPTQEEARKIAATIVEERLAACANIIPGMQSIYHWQGKVEHADDIIVIFKTKAGLYQAVEDRVKAMHRYETPCIVSWAIKDGSADFMQWIQAETRPLS